MYTSRHFLGASASHCIQEELDISKNPDSRNNAVIMTFACKIVCYICWSHSLQWSQWSWSHSWSKSWASQVMSEETGKWHTLLVKTCSKSGRGMIFKTDIICNVKVNGCRDQRRPWLVYHDQIGVLLKVSKIGIFTLHVGPNKTKSVWIVMYENHTFILLIHNKFTAYNIV